jgi:hypothetical protein
MRNEKYQLKNSWFIGHARGHPFDSNILHRKSNA